MRFGTKNSSEIINVPYGEVVYEACFSDQLHTSGRVRVLFLTDLHVGRKIKKLEKSLLGVAGALEHVDLILLGGDLVRNETCWPNVITLLDLLPSTLFRGAVMGNWEYKVGGGRDCFVRHITEAGFTPMRNSVHPVKCRNETIYVAGLDDPRFGSRNDDLLEQLQDISGFRLLVAHSPDVMEYVPKDCFDLLLCGHAHGGQIRIPYYGALWTSTHLGKKYEAGRYEPFPEKVVYVSKGIGSVHLPVRVNCPREITVFDIESKS